MSQKLNRVAFIGLGVMGSEMAAHIARKSPFLTSMMIHSRTKANVPNALLNGEIPKIQWFDSVEELMKDGNPQVVLTCLGYPSDVRDTYFNKILPNASKDMIAIDCTTSEAALAEEIAKAASLKGVHVLDAPVSGGDIGAKAGTLTAFVGGNEDILNQVRPIMECFCKNVNYFGEAGKGMHAKAANQVFIATAMIGVVEGMMYAYRAGLDVEKVIQACSGGAANSFSMTAYGPRILNRDMKPGFSIAHFVKDLKIVQDSCERMNLQLPGMELAKKLYESLIEEGHGKKGTQALVLALEKVNNLEVKQKMDKQ